MYHSKPSIDYLIVVHDFAWKTMKERRKTKTHPNTKLLRIFEMVEAIRNFFSLKNPYLDQKFTACFSCARDLTKIIIKFMNFFLKSTTDALKGCQNIPFSALIRAVLKLFLTYCSDLGRK